MMNNRFSEFKNKFDEKYNHLKEIDCIVPVHLTKNKKEMNLFKKDGTHNEQYYKWQFIYSYIESGLCGKDYIGTEVQFPKGNKNSQPIKIDAVIFDDSSWFEHYKNFWSNKNDDKWDELIWLKNHMICAFESKKENSKDIKGVFTSQLKPYMSESQKENAFGVLYDEERLYLFRTKGKSFFRLSDEFNIDNKGKIEMTFDLPDSYENVLSLNEMINYNDADKTDIDYSGRTIEDLSVISKTDSKKLNDALYNILHTMDKCGLVNQRGYSILIQLLALKIYDEKHNKKLEFYINPNEENSIDNLSDVKTQNFIKRINDVQTKAKPSYTTIFADDSFDRRNKNHMKVVATIVKQFQNYCFVNSKRNNLYQLVFYRFASQFSKADNAQFITPLQIIDFVVDIVNPSHNESIIDPCVGIADFLSVSYVKSDGKLDDTNVYGIDIDADMIKLATLNMLLNGDGNAKLESITDGLGSLRGKFSDTGKIINLIPMADGTHKNNYNGDWDNRVDGENIKKFDIVMTNPPFGEARSWVPSVSELPIAKCYETFNLYKQDKIDMGVVFLENAVRVLKTNGRMAIVLSNSIASVDAHKEARQWLLKNMRVVAIFDLPANVFAEAGVSPTIIVAYKPEQRRLKELINSNYEIFSKEIKKVGYEVKTKNKVKVFEPQFKLDPVTFEKEINEDGTAKLDEEFTDTVKSFKDWCLTQENEIKELFLKETKK